MSLWTALRRLFTHRGPDYVSPRWLASQDRMSSRVEHHGVSIRFPVQKIANESPLWNARKLKRRA